MNRQTKRQMQRTGADQRPRPQPQRRGAPTQESERTGPAQYVREVRQEMRRVDWPSREEVINSSLVVLVAVIVLTLVIFGFDWASSKFVLFLYQ